MDIDQTLAQVGQYFKDKLMTGDFKFLIMDTPETVSIEIDGKYKFRVWIANTPKDHLEFYFIMGASGVLISFQFTSQQQRLKAWQQIKPMVEAYKQKQLKRQKQKEYNRLKKELLDLGGTV